MKIITKKVGEPAVVKELETLELGDMQSLVGGWIEVLHVGGNIDMWLNDSGKIDNLPINIVLGSEDYEILDSIHGDIFFARSTPDGGTVGLTDSDIVWIQNNLDNGQFAVSRGNDGKIVFCPVWVYNPSAS